MANDLFPSGSYKDIRLTDKIEELTRELKMRRHVYPRLVGLKKLNEVTADRRMLIIKAILRDYQEPRLEMLEQLLEEWSELNDGCAQPEHHADIDTRTRKALGLAER